MPWYSVNSAVASSLLGCFVGASHSALALGVVTIAIWADNIVESLFGDLLLVTPGEPDHYRFHGLLVWALLKWCWNAMVAAALGELAATEGQSPRLLIDPNDRRRHRCFVKLVSALLIMTMLILPAAVPRASSLEHMAVWPAVSHSVFRYCWRMALWPAPVWYCACGLTMFIITQ